MDLLWICLLCCSHNINLRLLYNIFLARKILWINHAVYTFCFVFILVYRKYEQWQDKHSVCFTKRWFYPHFEKSILKTYCYVKKCVPCNTLFNSNLIHFCRARFLSLGLNFACIEHYKKSLLKLRHDQTFENEKSMKKGLSSHGKHWARTKLGIATITHKHSGKMIIISSVRLEVVVIFLLR